MQYAHVCDDRDVIVIIAPGTTAPFGSVIRPEIPERGSCDPRCAFAAFVTTGTITSSDERATVARLFMVLMRNQTVEAGGATSFNHRRIFDVTKHAPPLASDLFGAVLTNSLRSPDYGETPAA